MELTKKSEEITGESERHPAETSFSMATNSESKVTEKDVIEALIQEIEQRPTIWDPNSEFYMYNKIRQVEWEKIAEILTYRFEFYDAKSKSIPQIACKLQRKWGYIKETYSKALYGNISYIYEDMLKFLKPVILGPHANLVLTEEAFFPRMDLDAGSRNELAAIDFLATRPVQPWLPQALNAQGILNYHMPAFASYPSVPLIAHGSQAVLHHPLLPNHSPSSHFFHPYSPGYFSQPRLHPCNASVRMDLNAGLQTGLSAVDFLALRAGVPPLPQPLPVHRLLNYHPLLWDPSIPLIPRSPPAVSQHPHLWNHSPSSPFSHPYSTGDSSQPPLHLIDRSVRVSNDVASSGQISRYPSFKHSLTSTVCSPHERFSSSKCSFAQKASTSKDSSSCEQASPSCHLPIEKNDTLVPFSSCRQISTSNDPTDIRSSSSAFVPFRQVSASNNLPDKQTRISTQTLSRDPASTSQKQNPAVVETSEESEPRCLMMTRKSVKKRLSKLTKE